MLDGMAKTHGERGESSLPNGSGLLDYAEDMLGGLWKGLMDAKGQVEAIMESSGLAGFMDKVRGFTEEYMNAPGDYIRGKGEYFGSTVVNGVRNVWDGVKGFGERTGNWVTGDGFNTDEQVEQIKEQQRIEEICKDQNLKENQKLVDAKYGESYTKAVPETDNSKAVQVIKDKLASGKDVSEAELKAFFDSAKQNSNGNTTLEKELMITISSDPDAFKEAMKTKGLDPNNDADVQKFSREMQAGFCVLFTEYAQMTLNNVDGTPPSVGEFYKDLLDGTSNNGGKLIDVLNQMVSTQEIFDSIVGAGKVKVIGYGKDRNGEGFKDGDIDNGGYSGPDMIDKLDELANDTSIRSIIVRLATDGGHYHNVTLINDNKNLKLYDNSYRGSNIGRSEWSRKYINSKKIKSLYYTR